MINRKIQTLTGLSFFRGWNSFVSMGTRGRVYAPLPRRRPAAVDQLAQENPPGEAHEPADIPPVSPPDPEEKTDRSFSVAVFPQEGQLTRSSSSLRKQRCSKTFPHSLHLNSYMGILFFPSRKQKHFFVKDPHTRKRSRNFMTWSGIFQL